MTKKLKLLIITNVFMFFSFACFAQTVIGTYEARDTSITNYQCPRGQVFFYDPVYRTGYCGQSTYYPYANMYVSPTGVTPTVTYTDTYTRRNKKICSTYVYSNNKKYTYCRNSIDVEPSYVYQMPEYVYYGNYDPYPYLREKRAIRNSPRCPSGYLYIPSSNMCASPNVPVIVN